MRVGGVGRRFRLRSFEVEATAMCGLIGFAGDRLARPVLLDGLEHARRIAQLRGLNVDRPRNPAKTVTVE
jgi:glucosamine 6-phosphate synthetase-like amidotransferase/phosphosugar isomerase protein